MEDELLGGPDPFAETDGGVPIPWDAPVLQMDGGTRIPPDQLKPWQSLGHKQHLPSNGRNPIRARRPCAGKVLELYKASGVLYCGQVTDRSGTFLVGLP